MHNDSYKVLLPVLNKGGITNSSKRLRLVSPSSKLLWIIRNHLPTSYTNLSRHSG